MIFVTVGAQMPFDRLVHAVDSWAAANPAIDVFAQVGPSAATPRNIRFTGFLDPLAFQAAFAEADLVVAHAGMGTIITAIEAAKPLLIMPRRGDLGETRNDHQIATAHRFEGISGVHVAMDAELLRSALDGFDPDRGRAGTDLQCMHAPCPCPFDRSATCPGTRNGTGCPHLISVLHHFIQARADTSATELVRLADTAAASVDG